MQRNLWRLGAATLAMTLAVAVPGAPASAATGARPLFQLPFPCGESWHLDTYVGHDDYDIDMTANSGTTNGRRIVASAAGTVTAAGWSDGGGNYVKLNHGGGWESLYLHMIEPPIVSTGQSVAVGQQLGRVGSTGDSSGPHLHHEQRLNGAKRQAYFDGVPSSITSDGTSATGPLYINGPKSGPRNVVSHNGCPTYGGGDLAWLQGSALFTFSGSGLSTIGGVNGLGAPAWAGVGDYSHDGRDDLFWFYGDGSIHVCESNGSSFSCHGPVRGPGIGAPTWAGVGDFDADGFKDDIAWLQGSALFTFSGTGLATIGTTNGIGTPTWGAGVGDYNHDGRDDLFWFYPDGSIHICESNGSAFVCHGPVRGPGLGTPSWTGVGDFDADGFKDDIAWLQGTALFTFSGSGLSTIGTTNGLGMPTWAGVGDYNHDGRDDLYWLYPDGSIHICESNSTTFGCHGPVRGPGVGIPTWSGIGNFHN